MAEEPHHFTDEEKALNRRVYSLLDVPPSTRDEAWKREFEALFPDAFFRSEPDLIRDQHGFWCFDFRRQTNQGGFIGGTLRSLLPRMLEQGTGVVVEMGTPLRWSLTLGQVATFSRWGVLSPNPQWLGQIADQADSTQLLLEPEATVHLGAPTETLLPAACATKLLALLRDWVGIAEPRIAAVATEKGTMLTIDSSSIRGREVALRAAYAALMWCRPPLIPLIPDEAFGSDFGNGTVLLREWLANSGALIASFAPETPPPPDRIAQATEEVNVLWETPYAERNEEWKRRFLSAAPDAVWDYDPKPFRGPDRFPYAILRRPTRPGAFPVLLRAEARRFVQGWKGAVIEPDDREPGWVFPLGDLLTLVQQGRFVQPREHTERLAQGEIAEVGHPNEELFPTVVREAVGLLLRSAGIERPKAALVMRSDRQLYLAFNVPAEKSGLIRQIAWYLPTTIMLAQNFHDEAEEYGIPLP